MKRPFRLLMTRLIPLMLLGMSATIVPGCSPAVMGTLPKIITAVQDASIILDSMESFMDIFFAKNPDSQRQDKVKESLMKCRSALTLALRATEGAQKLTQSEINAAFADFRAAYEELLVLVSPIGIRQADALSAPKSTPTQLIVPEPMALQR